MRTPQLNLDDVAEQACNMILQHGGFVPALLLVGDRGLATMEITLGAERREMMMAVGQTIRETNAVGHLSQAFFVAEAYASEQMEVAPSLDPNRKEILVVAAYTFDTSEHSARVFELKRDARDVLREIVAVDLEGATVGSPLMEAFVDGYGGVDGAKRA